MGDNTGIEWAELRERVDVARGGLSAMIIEWEKMTRYGSPLATRANEQLALARAAEGRDEPAAELEAPGDEPCV